MAKCIFTVCQAETHGAVRSVCVPGSFNAPRLQKSLQQSQSRAGSEAAVRGWFEVNCCLQYRKCPLVINGAEVFFFLSSKSVNMQWFTTTACSSDRADAGVSLSSGQISPFNAFKF